ncbi:MAG: ATP-dependent DNA helicase RecG [Treponema sp.]|nr:ATP-dependent DNA helicase RecG [Treponema sp.]
MKIGQITTPVSNISGVGEKAAFNLSKLNIFSVADLLQHYPREWEDRTKRIPLAFHDTVKKIHTVAKVLAHEYFGFGRMRTLKIIIDDGTRTAGLVCFNRNFLENSLTIGSIINISGSFSIRYGELQSSSFETEVLSKSGELHEYKNCILSDSKVFPIYPLTAGITQTQMRKFITRALKSFGKGIENELPESVIKKHNLLNKQDAIFKMHLPETLAETELAKHSLIFEELFLFQKQIIKRYYERNGRLPDINTENILHGVDLIQEVSSSCTTTIDNSNTIQNKINQEEKTLNISSTDFTGTLSPKQKKLFSRLPFTLTNDQMRAIIDINADIDRCYMSTSNKKATTFEKPPMSRLLQGDVGSGKTLVAFFACLRQIDYDGQCAILAPTELLARQHADNAANLLEVACGIRLAFLTGNLKTTGRAQLVKQLKNGDIDIVIGTHALFSQDIIYHNLRLVIIDEQHRFGVVQRNAILEKGRTSMEAQKKITNNFPAEQINSNNSTPSLLMMSATPIPQTLALTVFGDLDISNIRSMPQGRLPIKTHLTRRGNEAKAYEAVRTELRNGHQAYFVYPLIEQGENNNLKSAEESFEFLSKRIYPEYKCALVHSQIDDSTQHQILTDFKNGKIDVIVATSVVEVGVDVPNATCMVIEQAERFGLAALHQLRGRVGRGKNQSYCFLIYSQNLTENGKARLKALYENTDGFIIAEKDMKLRGPGEVAGIQQSGYLTLGLADPIRDIELLLITRTEVIENF